MEALKSGSKVIGLIEDELEALEVEKNALGHDLDLLGIDIEKMKKYVIDRELMRKVIGEFGSLYDKLETDRKINLIRLLVREIEYFKDRVKIKLRDLTESGEKMSLLLSEPVRFAQYQLLLPGRDSNRAVRNRNVAFILSLIFDFKR